MGVPKSAVVYEGEKARVFVLRADGTVQSREVAIGRESGDMIEVARGLAEGEKVVTAGAVFIDRETARS